MSQPWRVRVTGPLVPYMDGLRSELAKRGYTPLSAAEQLGLAAHLSCWLASQHMNESDLTPPLVEEFLEARRRQGYTKKLSKRSLSPLLHHLSELGIVPNPTPYVATTPVEKLLVEYRSYLLRERGLMETTVNHYEVTASLFLSSRLDGTAGDLEALTAGDVVQFVLRECRRRSAGYARHLVSQLRALLRYLHVAGHIQRPLAQAVPSVAVWRGSSLPRALSAEQVARILAGCQRSNAVGRRDYAILVLLARLGLRANEVATLELEDIDWRHGEIAIRGKGRRQERLPLPMDVGEALVDYLRHGRPHRECSRLFTQARAPYGELSDSAVKAAVRLACDRAGVPQVGTHRLRHTAASAMLREGASLPEIGQVLRHSSLTTTAIYAKVDRATLRSLAQPWPGGVE